MKTVLYVEDDEYIVEIMKDILDAFFDEVYVAYDGEEGLKLYKEKNPDIVLSDILMPKMNGLELSEKILEIKKEQKIILITADNENNYQEKAKKLGVYGYLNKPIDFNDLQKLIS
jgi:YesN/AraC family two-component response regulator